MSATSGSALRETLRGLLQSEEDVELAYLFGSSATTQAAEANDVDVAIGFTAPVEPLARLQRLGRIEDRLRVALGRPIDVVDLYRAPPLLLHEILRVGRPPFLVRDEKQWLLFENAERKRYFDMKRRYEVYDREGFR